MSYKVLIFGCSWEIDDMKGRKVCEGFLPNNPTEGFRMHKHLHDAQYANDDSSVKELMQEWMEKPNA